MLCRGFELSYFSDVSLKRVLILITIISTILGLAVLLFWYWTKDAHLEPLAQIFATVAGLAGFVASLLPSTGK